MVIAGTPIDGQWWLIFPVNDTLTYTLSLERVENDVDIQFFIEVSRDVYLPLVDPLPTLAVASLGISPLIYALFLAWKLDSLLKPEEGSPD